MAGDDTEDVNKVATAFDDAFFAIINYSKERELQVFSSGN